MIKITHNGRPFNADQFGEELHAAAMEMAMDAIEEKARGAASSIVDPETGKHATVFVDRLPGNRVGIKTTGSPGFARVLEKRLGVEPGEVSLIEPSPGAAHPKVYLAHAKEDADMVRPLAEYLMANGVETWFDEWEIDDGESLRQKMEEGLGAMTHFVVILTPTSIKKPWVNREIDVGLVRLVGGQSRMVPLRIGVEMKDLSPFLQTIMCREIDLASDDARKDLVARLHGVSRKPKLGDAPQYVRTVPDGLEGWSPAAVAVAQYLVKASVNAVALDPIVEREAIVTATGLPDDDVRLALLDLYDAGMLWQSDSFGDDSVAPEGAMFVEFDASVMDFDPRTDALTIANRVLNDEHRSESVPSLAEMLDWPPRRMNSAICYLERAGAIDTRNTFGADPWRVWQLDATDKTLRFSRNHN